MEINKKKEFTAEIAETAERSGDRKREAEKRKKRTGTMFSLLSFCFSPPSQRSLR
jgi:hypothetical protein